MPASAERPIRGKIKLSVAYGEPEAKDEAGKAGGET
jgi:hypothetical protein